MGKGRKNYNYNDSTIDSLMKSHVDLGDSDDPFEELEGNKNINFTRSTSYIDLHVHDFTPERSKVIEKENLKPNHKTFYSVGKNIYRSKCDLNVTQSPLKTNNSLNTNKNTFNANLSPNYKQFGNKMEALLNSYESCTTNHPPIAYKSPHTPSNLLATKSLHDDSRGSSLKYTPNSSFDIHLNQSVTPISKITTPSFKKYSLQKVALAAKKDFEDIMEMVKEKKRLASFNQAKEECSNIKNSAEAANKENSVTKQIKSSVHNTDNSIEDDDLPCTQPMSSIILHGVVAYVEVRSGKDSLSNGTVAELISLGAKVEKNFTRKVTHCFFHGGRMSTYRKAVEWKIPILSILWIEACKAELRMVPIEGHEPFGIEKYKEALPLYKLKAKIRRPMTDSKLSAKVWKKENIGVKFQDVVEKKKQEGLPESTATTSTIIKSLHSVADDLKKATDQFQKILTSPVLQETIEKPNKNVLKTKENKNSVKKKHNKKLVFPSSNEDEQNVQNVPDTCDNSRSDSINNSNETIRVSYDSDDLLVYAKKQASSIRCSAPARLLTSRKCKKLLYSAQKSPKSPFLNVGSSKTDKAVTTLKDQINDNVKNKTRKPKDTGTNLFLQPGSSKFNENKDNTRKRKLILPTQVIKTFRQDSEESASDLSPVCPYKESPKKRAKTSLENKNSKHLFRPIFSDCDSDDSFTRAARRESSALFVKKEKKPVQRSTPTIVCTSLLRSDAQVVSAIVSKLGRFAVESAVSENTTHLVTCSTRRTINMLKAIARGCWVLNVKWVYESLEAGKWLHEERFEFLEFSSSVQSARIERQAFGPEFSLELFKGVGLIYVCRTNKAPTNDLMELIRLCGGTVVSNARVASIIIGPGFPLSPTGRSRIVVSQNWVLDSITRLTQLNPHDYIAKE